MTTREIVEMEVREAMQSGLYDIADLSMFDKIDSIVIDENLRLHLGYTVELINEYLKEILELEGNKPGLIEFLKAIKDGDVIDNQSLEKENSFLIGLYSQMSRETAMEKLIRYSKNGKVINGKNVIALNSTLLYGTASEETETVRIVNDKFVGRFVNGERVIDYFPIDYKDVKVAATKIAELYNSRMDVNGFDNVFFQPFVIHGLVASLQLFKDGNTRLARVFQHALIWQLINERTEFNFPLPPIYATRSYFPYRGIYRDKIYSLVKYNNSEVWNDWFDFNLSRMEDSIYIGRENIKTLKRKINTTKKINMEGL